MKFTQNKKPIMITFTIMILLELADLLSGEGIFLTMGF